MVVQTPWALLNQTNRVLNDLYVRFCKRYYSHLPFEILSSWLHANLCNKFGPATIKYDLESANQHATTHFHQSNIIDDQVLEDQIFEECFPVYQERAVQRGQVLPKNLSRQILVDVCHSLFSKKRISDSLSHVACSKCGAELKLLVLKGKCLNTKAIIEHACGHTNEKQLYACNHCSRQCNTRCSIWGHLGRVHGIKSTDGHYEDKSPNFVNEISALIKSCFGPNKKQADVDGKCAKSRAEQKDSDLAIQRKVLCRQLIKKIVDRAQNVKCRLCSSRISVKDGNCRSAMQHVLMHSQKPAMRVASVRRYS